MRLTSRAGFSLDTLSARGAARRRSLATAGIALAAAAALTASLAAQATTAKPATQKPAPARAAAAGSGVDSVIELVKGGLSEALVITTLKKQGKAYTLTPADLVKLQRAGVSENVINVMMDPGGAAPAATPTAAAATGAATPFPPDLPDVPTGKRRVAVRAFDYSTVTSWVNYWFNNNTNIGEGIRSMLTVRLQKSNTVTMLERANIDDILKEQDFGASNRVRKGSNARVGQITGADAILMGDIVIFGRDDTTKRKGAAAIIRPFSGLAAGLMTMNKEEKAVVGINLRLVDAETAEVIETGEARGESSRSSKDYAGVLGVKGAAAGAGSSMTSSNFAETIIGEATSNAVTKIVEYLETRVPTLPAKARQIEGRVASVNSNSAVLTVGMGDGVLRGDRFEILRINGEIVDPVTKEVIDLDAVKVGEMVIDTVRDRSASGAYGGQPLSSEYATTGKGYAARLMSK